MKKALYIFASFGIFAALLVFPKAAAEAVKAGLIMCAQMIIPSLFPFFVCANLFCALHLTQPLERALSGVMQLPQRPPLGYLPWTCRWRKS